MSSPGCPAIVSLVIALALGLAMAPAAHAGPASAARAPSAASAPPADAPFAVVELFTSEGCSSCPPADALLSRLADESRADGRRVFPLEFHVDYWNSLGWRDPFSSAAATERQRRYAEALGLEQVYTPQMLVNGRSEFVGSNEARARREIAAALARPASVRVELSPAASGAGGAGAGAGRYRVRISPAPRGTVIVLARVESNLAVKVARGENGGRLLRHSSVVRAFATAEPGADGAAVLALGPRAKDAGPARLVAFAQDRATLAILGAIAAPESAPTAR